MIRKASAADIPFLVRLINSAYRGEVSKKGWTTEADLISGAIRTDESQLRSLIEKPGSVILVCLNENDETEGCVYLEKQSGKLYLGMLSVPPDRQARGTGKKLMEAAEQYARAESCKSIFMRVISLRTELITWYEKQGFVKTGEKQPFENSQYGTALLSFEFLILEKPIEKSLD